ncbi:hypothetical protein Rhow_000727 [Rhodococcus wratislaviensis]|uniref:Uncharacterized protein n=1 Tax=Rhodococcus wratislaviensis TaxID=44752 RepID=A0A402C2H8_RHOWR|nr:hypothetical protein Rhow_000727 [Rhodococcus wratislaviensis]
MAEHLDLGQAVTGHSAQGAAVGTTHAVIAPEPLARTSTSH